MSGEPVAPASPAPPPAVESMPREECAAEIAQMRGNPDHDVNHEGRPGHKAATERKAQLYQRVYGTERASVFPSKPGGSLDASGAPTPSKSDLQRTL